MAPTLSVIVPYYNVERYLQSCLESIRAQSFPHFEVILVDDGSEDNSRVIAERMCEEDTRFRLVTQQNQGLGPARNTGIDHARGEYISFVDSDDIIPRRAYELMVTTLDRTGSSLIAGNARRFTSAGSYQSYVHRLPFASKRIATHIQEFPELALDRMVWNKVFRRSSWEEHGYRFPPIRYEDYPITLAAHLDAVTVDCLATPVYYWRDRETGDSITQRYSDLPNIRDRVVSAGLVLDLIGERAKWLRRRVEEHFIETDLVAISAAFSTERQDLPDVMRLAQRLVARLQPNSVAGASQYAQLQVAAIRSGDLDFARRLSSFRTNGGLRGGSRAAPRKGLPWILENDYPGRGDRHVGVSRRLYRVPTSDVILYTTVTALEWKSGGLSLSGTAEIRHIPTPEESRLTVWAVSAEKRIQLPASRFESKDSHGERGWVGFGAFIAQDVLQKLGGRGETTSFELELQVRRMRRVGRLTNPQPGSPLSAPGRLVGKDLWAQPRVHADGTYGIEFISRPWIVDSVVATDGVFRILGSGPAAEQSPDLAVTRSGEEVWSTPLVLRQTAGGSAFEVGLPLDVVTDVEFPDDPVTLDTTWGLQLVSERLRRGLLPKPVSLVSAMSAGRIVRMDRSRHGRLLVRESSLRCFVDSAEIRGDSIVARGRLMGPVQSAPLVWRHFLPDDSTVDVPCSATTDGEEWEAVACRRQVAARIAQLMQRGKCRGETLWLLAQDNGTGAAVGLTAGIRASLPRRVTWGRGSATLLVLRGALWLRVGGG